ncbi:MAG: nuclear transport factor 2 family protein [Gemmatimonadales bacterium]
MLKRALLAAAVMILPLAAFRAGQPSPEEAAVRSALEHYLAGHATGVGDHFRQGMHTGGTMYWAREGALATRSFPDYAAGAPGKPAADEDKRRRRIAMVDITNDAAVAKIVLEYPGATLTDYMTLLKVDGKWQIVAKAFTRQPAS